jgi:hypothetical protein
MKRIGLGCLVALSIVGVGAGAGAGCSGGAKTKPQPTLGEGEPTGDPGRPDEPQIAEPAAPVDPAVVPDGTVATFSLGDPATVLTGLGSYLSTAGFTGATATLGGLAGMTGLALDKPIIMVVVYGDMGPEPVVAGIPLDQKVVEQFARSGGLAAEIQDGVVVLGRLEQLDRVGPHLRWRIGQPVPAELRFEVASQMVNQVIAVASATMPNNPLAGFDSIEKLSGSMTFDANEATLKVLVDGRAGTGLATFAQSLAPSDFRLAGIVARPGDVMFAAGTFDYKLIGEGLRKWLGPVMDLWRSIDDVADGSVALSMPKQGEMTTVLGIKAGMTERAVAAYEKVVRGMATPVVVLNTAVVGRVRTKKLGKFWFHAVDTTFTDAATEEERAAARRMFGEEATQALVGVIDGLAITTQGKVRDKAAADVIKRAKAKGASTIKSPGVLAAIEEARVGNEAFVMTMDLGTWMAWVAAMDPAAGGLPAGVKAGKPSGPSVIRPLVRMGMGRVGDGLGVRMVIPAQQMSAVREVMEPATP